MAYSGSILQRSDMKPWISLIPRSVYWPLRHMSHSPTAQLGQGTGSGRRTIPTTRSPFLSPPARSRVHHAPERFVAEDEARLAGRSPAVLPLDDLDVGPADADGDGLHEDRPLRRARFRNLLQPGGPGLAGLHGDGFHALISMSKAW